MKRKLIVYKKDDEFYIDNSAAYALKLQNVRAIMNEKTHLFKINTEILTILFRNYWASPEQREKLIGFTKNAQSVIEKEDRERYNPDNIFKNRNMNNVENIHHEQALVEYKESIFKKIINKILNIFKFR